MPDVQITLPRDAVGQILDGIEVLIEQWVATEQYLATGLVSEIGIRDATDPEEAANIAEYYRDIASRIRAQLAAVA